MLTKYLQAFISAENKKQANKILDVLLKKKLIAGGLILHGPTRFWWKGKIINTNYYNISAFTLLREKLRSSDREINRRVPLTKLR